MRSFTATIHSTVFTEADPGVLEISHRSAMITAAVLALSFSLDTSPRVQATASRPALTLVEHALPLMEPQRYESALRAAMAPQGEMVRWAISRVDEETATAYAEVVLSLHPEVDVKVTRPGIRRMLSMPSESQG